MFLINIYSIMAIPNFRYSFARGIEMLPLNEAKAINAELYSYLDCKSKSDYSRRKRAYRNIPLHVYRGINEIFAKYGITNELDIWNYQKI